MFTYFICLDMFYNCYICTGTDGNGKNKNEGDYVCCLGNWFTKQLIYSVEPKGYTHEWYIPKRFYQRLHPDVIIDLCCILWQARHSRQNTKRHNNTQVINAFHLHSSTTIRTARLWGSYHPQQDIANQALMRILFLLRRRCILKIHGEA